MNFEESNLPVILSLSSAANTSEESGTIEIEQTVNDFLTMYSAGNATTQSTMNYLLNDLVRNPEVMEKLVEEVKDKSPIEIRSYSCFTILVHDYILFLDRYSVG